MTTAIGKWIIIVACTVSLVVGLVGNFLIILIRIVNHTKRKNITAYTYLVCQLGVADFLFAFTLVFDIPFILKNSHWEFGLGLCKFIKTLQSTSLSTTVGFLMLMAYERYLGISNPLGHRWSIKKTTFLVIGIWIYIILTMIPFFLALNISYNECYDVNYSSKDFSKGYTLFLFITNYILPLFFITFFHTLIVKRLNVHIKKMAPHTNRSIRRKKDDRRSLNRNSSCSLGDSRRNRYDDKACDFTEVSNCNESFIGSERKNLFDQKSIFNNNQKNASVNLLIEDNKNNNVIRPKICGNSYNDNKIVLQKDSITYNKCRERKITNSLLSSFSKICTKKHSSSNHKVIKMLLAVTLCFSVMTLPTQMWYIWDIFSVENSTTKTEKLHLIEVLSSLTYLHCCSNCIIYSVMDKRFRKDVSVLVLSVFRKKLRSTTLYSRVSSTFSHISVKRLHSNGIQNECKEELIVIEKETVFD